MRQAHMIVLVVVVWAVCGGALAAQERGDLLVGLDTGLLLDSPRSGESEFRLLPPFASYFLTERLRLGRGSVSAGPKRTRPSTTSASRAGCATTTWWARSGGSG